MKSAAFEYSRPGTVAEAVALLAGAEGAAMPIGGGQSLLILMGLRLTMIDTLVDVSRLPDLREVRDDGGHVFIGASTTHAMIEDGKIPDPSSGLMSRVAGKIAYRAIRNLGTIGGSMALADPSADWPACLMALDAEVSIVGSDGPRWEKAETFVRGAYETSLAPAEIVVGFRIARRKPMRWGTAKVSRKSGAFADSMAVFVETSGEARVALTGTTSHARILPRVSQYAQDHGIVDPGDLRAVILDDLTEIVPDADAYQRRCHIATVSRAITEARNP
ncbi:MAG: molybdopterin dehydrogenase [Tardiphaga sp.]|jgi:carbon-monoxide dehydrogenase medium subunit|nr:molybdopterin dehydrogenase [Tardiphaga sp.]